jgi:hypothetical protein
MNPPQRFASTTSRWQSLPARTAARQYSQDAARKLGFQVKALSKRNAVGLGKSPVLIADWLVVCRHAQREKPECFTLSPDDVKQLAGTSGKDSKL